MPIELPIKFPKNADVIYADAKAFQALPPEERWRRLCDLIASGEALMAQSPERQETARRLRERDELRWQQAMRFWIDWWHARESSEHSADADNSSRAPR
ncbi:MAG: hypothetical protein KY476_09585 [Planctomycetes bacterium]|nr:hypothetical protein [Planctomycetota bacterium]